MRWGGRSDRPARNDERVGRRGGEGREGKGRKGKGGGDGRRKYEQKLK